LKEKAAAEKAEALEQKPLISHDEARQIIKDLERTGRYMIVGRVYKGHYRDNVAELMRYIDEQEKRK